MQKPAVESEQTAAAARHDPEAPVKQERSEQK